MNEAWMPYLFFALLALLLWRNLPGAIAFLRPGWIRVRTLGGPERLADHPAIRQAGRELEALGFAPVGAVAVGRPLEPSRTEYVFHSAEDAAFAVLFLRSGEAWLHFVSAFPGGGRIVTADHRLPPVDEKGYLSGGIPGASPEEVLATHRRRVQGFREEGQAPVEGAGSDPAATLEAWAAGERRFYGEGKGRGEVRRKEARRFLVASAGVAWGVMTVWGWMR